MQFRTQGPGMYCPDCSKCVTKVYESNDTLKLQDKIFMPTVCGLYYVEPTSGTMDVDTML